MKNKNIIIIAGPCVIESYDMLDETASGLKQICSKYSNIELYFKASYKKANRSSINSFTGVGGMKGLEWLKQISEKYTLKTLTDVHESSDVNIVASYVDVLQIPAFLSRQTDLLLAVAATHKQINIKKAQFMAPKDMNNVVEKILSKDNHRIWLTERGTCFGYHDLVVDFRNIVEMKKLKFPVIFDATHSVQQPSANLQFSGGQPEYIFPLTKAALAIGVDGIFFETHPDPINAKSDSATQISLNNVIDYIDMIMKLKNSIEDINN